VEFQELLKTINIPDFQNLELLDEAFTHRSFSKKHNERLEFLGDAVLELVITELLYKDFTDRTEGELTSFRAAVVRTESLADEALRLGLGELIRMSKGEEATGGRSRQYILADVFESFVGAIYLEKGFEAAQEFIITNLYYKIQEIVASRSDIDAKSKLQELAQDKYKETPFYKVIKEEGPDHDKIFTVIVMIGSKEYEQGTGKSKQLAEQDSAAKTLQVLLTVVE
jgi:ribonuclease III